MGLIFDRLQVLCFIIETLIRALVHLVICQVVPVLLLFGTLLYAFGCICTQLGRTLHSNLLCCVIFSFLVGIESECEMAGTPTVNVNV